jgi:MtrB/PioB family decaheme-associated outer membrane protein
MRTRIIDVARCVAGSVMLVWPAASQGQADSGKAGKVTIAAEIGARSFTQQPALLDRAKFEEYKAVPSGAVLQQLLLGYTPPDGFRQVQLVARNIGQLDQSLALRGTEPGRFDLQLRWDRIPHLFSTNARSLGTAGSPDVFYSLPTPRPDTATWNRTAPYIAPVRTKWDAVRVAAVFTPTPEWDLKAEVTNIGKKGQRPMGMAMGSPGNNFREILEPIDQTSELVRLSQAFTRERFQLTAAYDFSRFKNAYASVTADNPLLSTDTPTGGPARGRTALAPDNSAHSAVVNGALNLPWHTRLNASASYAWWKQDALFIPPTINNTIVDSRIAGLPTHLGGATGTSSVNFAATSRPLRPLSVSYRFRVFSYRDDTELDSVAVRVVNDRSVSGAAHRERMPYTRKNADLSANWRLEQAPVTFSAGYVWDQWVRDEEARNMHRLGDDITRASVDYAPLEWLNLRTSFVKGFRRGNDPYIQNSTSDLASHRRFDEADRDRERTVAKVLLTPIDELSASLNWEVGKDEYPHSLYGTQSDQTTVIGGDVSWAPAEGFSLDAGYGRETFFTRLRSRYRTTGQLDNLTFDWVANNRDVVTTTNFGFTAVLVPDRWEAGGRLDIARARFVMATYNPTAPAGGTAAQIFAATAADLPEVTQTMQPMTLYMRYRYSSEWAATVRYQTERYDQNDFRTIGLKPAEGNGLFLGNNFNNYDARYLTFTISYRPALLRVGRSAM